MDASLKTVAGPPTKWIKGRFKTLDGLVCDLQVEWPLHYSIKRAVFARFSSLEPASATEKVCSIQEREYILEDIQYRKGKPFRAFYRER